jgi:hypothetical protein
MLFFKYYLIYVIVPKLVVLFLAMFQNIFLFLKFILNIIVSKWFEKIYKKLI